MLDELPRTATGKLQRYLMRGIVERLVAQEKATEHASTDPAGEQVAAERPSADVAAAER